MKRILVGVDGSEPGERALELAAKLAAAGKVPLVVAHVVRPVSYPLEDYGGAGVGVVDPAAIAELEGQAREFGQLLAQRAAERACALGVSAEPKVLRGTPPLELSEEAETGDYELVVVGNRGQGALKRVLMGSTSDRLLHLCKRPVLVVR
jgi:nucleotide-binding universal stress UspA family protein